MPEAAFQEPCSRQREGFPNGLVENAGPGSRGTGSRGVENTGSGVKHGVWKKRGLVENTGSSRKHGVSVENTGSKCKTRGNDYFAQQ